MGLRQRNIQSLQNRREGDAGKADTTTVELRFRGLQIAQSTGGTGEARHDDPGSHVFRRAWGSARLLASFSTAPFSGKIMPRVVELGEVLFHQEDDRNDALILVRTSCDGAHALASLGEGRMWLLLGCQYGRPHRRVRLHINWIESLNN